MKRYSFADTKVNHVLFALVMFAMLLLCRSSFYCREIYGFYESQAAIFAILGILGIAFLVKQRKHLKEIFTDSRMIAAGIFAVLMLLPMVAKRDWQLMYVSILIYIFVAVFFHYFLDIRNLARYYVVVLSALSVYAIACTYFLRLLPDMGIIQVPVVLSNSEFRFYNMGLSMVSLDYVTMRNFGIFREPGVYQFFILLGLFLNNYTADWEKPWQLWTINGILALTMLSTFATGGVVELGLLVIFLFWDKKWYRIRKARMMAYAAVLALIGAIVYILVTKNALYMELTGIFGKFDGDNETGGARFGSIWIDLQIFLHHPIFGAKLDDVLHALPDNTTSTMVMYAAFGFLTGSLNVLGWAALVWDKKRSVIGNLILMLILFMSFNTQDLSGDMMFWFFPILALLNVMVPMLDRKRRRGEA